MPGEGPGAGEMNVAHGCMEGLNREQGSLPDDVTVTVGQPMRSGWCLATWEPKDVTSAGSGEEEPGIKCPG